MCRGGGIDGGVVGHRRIRVEPIRAEHIGVRRRGSRQLFRVVARSSEPAQPLAKRDALDGLRNRCDRFVINGFVISRFDYLRRVGRSDVSDLHRLNRLDRLNLVVGNRLGCIRSTIRGSSSPTSVAATVSRRSGLTMRKVENWR